MELKQRVSSLELKPFSDGRFEVYVNSRKIFSKLEEHRFPDPKDVLKQLQSQR